MNQNKLNLECKWEGRLLKLRNLDITKTNTNKQKNHKTVARKQLPTQFLPIAEASICLFS